MCCSCHTLPAPRPKRGRPWRIWPSTTWPPFLPAVRRSRRSWNEATPRGFERGSDRARHAGFGPRYRRPRSPGCREDLPESVRGCLSSSHRYAPFGPHTGRNDAGGVHEALQGGAYSANHGQADGPPARASDLPGQLLSPQSAPCERHMPDPGRAIRRARADDDGRIVDAAWGGPKDREFGADSGVQEPREHLRRHACPPDLESAWMGYDRDAGRNRAGALRDSGQAMVAAHQFVPGHVGSKRLQAGAPSVRRMRPHPALPQDRRAARGQAATSERRRMNKRIARAFAAVFGAVAALWWVSAIAAQNSPAPVIVVETSKG